MRATSGFLAWAADDDQNYIPNKKYIAKFKRPKVVRVKPPYTEGEYNELVSYFNESNYEMALLLQFLWHTGSRCGEALEIKTSDIDLKNNRILIANKIFKGEQEYLLLTEQAVNIVNQLVELTKKRNDGKLFSWKETRLPNRCLERAENNLGLKIEGRGLHGFRRGFADRLFENCLEIPEVQEIMRHREINTTINHYKTTKQRMLLDKMNEKLK